MDFTILLAEQMFDELALRGFQPLPISRWQTIICTEAPVVSGQRIMGSESA